MERQRESERVVESRLDRARVHASSGESPASVVAAVMARLEERGPRDALALLNARTRFRFTGIYRAEPPLLRNIFLVDRENPAVNVSGAVCPLDETYCALTCAREAAFATRDAPRDARLVAHPARDSVISYSGVPLRLHDGHAWGTLCHFDLRPRLLPRAEQAVLEMAAPLFVRWLAERGDLRAAGEVNVPPAPTSPPRSGGR
ncbi:MAG: hypothetical protein HOQ11_09490 [Gemmatimonadaceae bacterium]|nr:hypothetical protein [Gemmatimonadaceae bacterium]NUR19993.1 hypothetical protein [Gemmatimonadaceae bacterium]NUS97629.1 hypothetical protein [Gemmatimonadaceae bacterium]